MDIHNISLLFPFLRSAGWDAIHVIDIGMQRASDVEIIAPSPQ